MSDSPDTALRNAIARTNELRARIVGAEASISDLTAQVRADSIELRRLARFIASWRSLAGDEAPPTERPKNPDRRDVADRALQIVRQARRPLARRELFERLAVAGVIINGKDPEMVLGTMLYRDDRIVRLRGHGYWPREEVYEPAFYIPEHEGVIGATEPKVMEEE
ncbi:hypothetical protein QH494_10075 [Sphingomonas sp. AR_OL41]|uniref:hypothetical protein n=1 Tax=Sphingomonas sp. AR_OL41 TaxID=3042729 RepID=UPI00247FC218|nr:hypothetical protein [Sphingomonas sp. AR_OL41]MDH7972529.1 hypothetical protein [Sphingomonas sp. AR_OL41]